MLKIALKNLKSKPWRTVATVFAIAVAVAMVFAMLSFKGAVYDYIGASETAVAGASDIKIATQSSSDRITTVTSDLVNIDGVEDVVPSLYLYAELDGEYVQARGFETGSLEKLQKIEIASGSLDTLNTDDVIVSEKAAKHFGVKVGDKLTLNLGNNVANVYVGAIAKASGYFLDDSPYLVLGNVKSVSGLIVAGETSLCNEIYVKVADGANADDVIASIKNIEQYKDLQVGLSHDYKYIDEQTTALTAPVVLAGAAVLVLAIVIVAFIFLIGEKDKTDLIARLRIVGATNGQIFGIFLIESAILSFVGGLVGSALAVGIFALIVRLTLKTSVIAISAVYLFVAAVIGIASAVASSILPIARSLKGSIRQNQVGVFKRSKFGFVVPLVFVALLVASVLVECLTTLTPYFAIVTLVLTLATLFTGAPYVLRGVTHLAGKVSNSSVKTACTTLPREKRFARSTSIFTVGIAISIMLFMAWNITTAVFDGYIKNFEDFVFVSNIKSTVDVNSFRQMEGVESATKMVWQKAELGGDNFEKTVNLLGSFDVVDMINFEFITREEQVKTLIETNPEPECVPAIHNCIVDVSLQKLYGVGLGDELEMVVKDKKVKLSVAAFVQHNLFNGNYVIVSSDCLAEEDIEVDTVLVVSSGDVNKTVGNIKQKYASQNYYVVDALEAYKWDKESTSAVFDLVGTLAIVVGMFILIVSVFAAIVGRSAEEKSRRALLSAGMSKNGLLCAEIWQHLIVALVAFVLAFCASALLAMSLIHALMLFGLYFNFAYSAWVVVVTGAVMASLYALAPLILNFKKGYELKKS